MKLLIVTQVVDQHDPILGFFHRWLEEFAKHCEQISVICLYEGVHTLPAHVHVYSLGKESGTSRLKRVARFIRYILYLRDEYDAVFVHMNPEYVVLGGLLWRAMGKRVALWYTHKSVTITLRVATLLAHVIFTASKESFRLVSGKVRIVGHGIDTDFFTPDHSVMRGNWLLSVGRLSRSKRHDAAIRLAVRENKPLRIAGEGQEQKNLEHLVQELHADVLFLGGLTQSQLRDEYRKAGLLVHTSETGSLDKVVLEAIACGLPIVTSDPALKSLEKVPPEYVRAHHSLSALIPRMLKELV